MLSASFLPGMEDVRAPAGLHGWDYALWRLATRPARRIVLLALRAIAGSRDECCPTNDAIRAKIAELGFTPPSERVITSHLRALEVEDRLIVRCVDRRAKSRRRLRFAFLGQPSFEGASDRRPWAPTTGAPPRRKSLLPLHLRRRPSPLLIQFRIQREKKR